MKRLLFILLWFMIIFLPFGCEQSIKPESREKVVLQPVNKEQRNEALKQEILDAVENEQYDYAKSIVGLIDDEELRNNLIKIINSPMLEIQPVRSIEYRGDYAYVIGRVKNISNKEINYFEVIVKFKDENGQVLDSFYTVDELKLMPGEIRGFEIKVRHSDDFMKYGLSIGAVNTQKMNE